MKKNIVGNPLLGKWVTPSTKEVTTIMGHFKATCHDGNYFRSRTFQNCGNFVTPELTVRAFLSPTTDITTRAYCKILDERTRSKYGWRLLSNIVIFVLYLVDTIQLIYLCLKAIKIKTVLMLIIQEFCDR